MNNIFKKIISGIITASMLMSSAIAVYAEGETETTSPWAVAKGANTFRFGVMTDIHTMPNDSNNVIQYMNMGLDAYNEMGVDGLALPGDIVMSGKTSTDTTIEENLYDKLTENLNTYGYEIKSEDDTKNDANKKPLAYGMGNHEMAENAQNATGIWAAKNLFVNANGIDRLASARKIGENYTGDYVTQMGGYTFIVSSANNGCWVNSNTPDAINGVKVDVEGWVKEKIKEATAAYKDAGTPNKPIFYIQHVPAQSHTGMTSYKTNSDDFMNWLKDYPNVVILSGHTHKLIDDPRCISQDAGYTSIVSAVMATGNASVWGATLDSNLTSGGASGIKQTMAIDATYDATNDTTEVKVYRLDIKNQKFIGKPFEFTINGEAQTKYSIANRFADEGKSTATWDEGTTMTAEAVEGTRNVKVTYSTEATSTPGESVEVLQDNFVWGYKAFAINALTKIAEKSTIRAAEFYKTTKTSPRTFTFTELERNQEYDIAIYPITLFQQNMTYAELDAANVVPMKDTVKVNNVKSDADRSQYKTINSLVSSSKTASYLQHDGTTTALTDGKDTSASEFWVNETPGVGFIIDLERSYKISNVVLEAVDSNTSGRNEFTIYGSNDKENWTELYERTTSDTGDAFGKNLGTSSSPSFETSTLNCSVNGEYCRYIKIWYLGYTILEEIKVYADVPVTNMAYGKDIITDYVANVNVSDATYWHQVQLTNGKDYGYVSATDKDFTVDLGKQYNIHQIVLKRPAAHDNDGASKYYTLYVSKDNQDWVPVGIANGTIDSKVWNGKVGTHFIDEDEEYRYIKYSHPYYFVLHEIEAYVVNPTVADFEYADGEVKLTFTDAMNYANVNEDIKVYDADGNAKAVAFTPNTDNTAVTFEAASGDRVVVSEYIENSYGTEMQKDVEYSIYDLSIDYSGKPTKKFENMNVAYGKNVISNYTATTYGGKQTLTDGENVSSRYVSASNCYFTIDLGRGYNINQIKLKMSASHSNRESKKNYTLSGSIDGENWVQIDNVGSTARDIWDGLVGTYNITEDVNYRYIKYHNTKYIVLAEIEVYADVEATQVTQKSNNVTSSAKSTHTFRNSHILDNDYNSFAYQSESGKYNWLTVQLDKAYPVGMIELYVRGWNANGSHVMGHWGNAHHLKVYGSNTVLDDSGETANVNVSSLTAYGYDELADTFTASPRSSLFPSGFGTSSLMPEEWIFTDGYKETLDNTKRYEYLTLKKYDKTSYFTMEYSEFKAYVLNSTINIVDTSSTGVDIHFGDKMVPDLLNADTITLKKDGTVIDYTGSLSDNKMVYSLDAALADGFYTLTVSKDVKNYLGVPMQADYTYGFVIGDVYGIKTLDGADVEALAPSTTYVVSEPISGEDARMAIAAIYDASDKLIVTSITDIPADYSSEYVQINIATPETLEAGAKVKFFLWKAGTLKPVIEAIPVIE